MPFATSRRLIGLAAGVAGALFLAYCVHFDAKRRADPDYKKKVHQRREQQRTEEQPKKNIKRFEKIDVNCQDDLERYFLQQIKSGERLIAERQIEDGIDHLANAVMICAQPAALVNMLQTTLAQDVFYKLIVRLQELSNQSGQSSGSEPTEIITDAPTSSLDQETSVTSDPNSELASSRSFE